MPKVRVRAKSASPRLKKKIAVRKKKSSKVKKQLKRTVRVARRRARRR